MRIPGSIVALVLTALVALAAAGCVPVLGSAPAASGAAPSTEAPGDRQGCDEIFGTAFRSAAERDWFNANCSKWPLVPVAQTTPGAQAQQDPETVRRCNEMRGRPYASAEQRQWYLANCQGQMTPTPTPQAGTNNAEQQPDRRNCDEISGTPYRSAAEQQWFQQNCGINQNANRQVTPAPAPSATCALLRARGYSNAVEREYFLRYCR